MMTDVAKKTAQVVKTGAQKTGEFVKKNPKTTLYLVGGGLILFLLYKVVSGIGKGINKIGDTISGENIDGNIELTLSVNPANLSITQAQAKQLASQLLTAFNWSRTFLLYKVYGTDNTVVASVFSKIKTPDDFRLVYNEFGLKHYNGYGSPPEDVRGGVAELIGVAKIRDLVYWLKAEISQTFDKTLYNTIKKRVESAGFAF